jgi:Domain of unknown function (DUF4360)
VDAPQDYTYAIAQTQTHGTASIAAGMTGMYRAITYFAGGAPRPWKAFQFRGPFDGEWTTRDAIPPEELVYVPCGSSSLQNLNAELRLGRAGSDPVAAPSVIALDTASYGLAWKRCG